MTIRLKGRREKSSESNDYLQVDAPNYKQNYLNKLGSNKINIKITLYLSARRRKRANAKIANREVLEVIMGKILMNRQ